MRLQLTALCIALATALGAAPARADDRVDFTTTWFLERRDGGNTGTKSLSVFHPQFNASIDAGEHTTIGVSYAADVVSGATAKVYSVDAVSSATTFDDTRQDGSFSLGFSGSRSRLTFTGGIATESDYHSFTAGASGDIDLPGKNTNVSLSYNHNFDEVCTRDNATATIFERRTLDDSGECHNKRPLFGKDRVGITLWQDLSIDTSQGTITQNLSPTTVAQVSLFGQILRGYLANPYRAVRVRSVEAAENMPTVRARGAISLRINRYLPALRAAVHASLRGYSDTWGVNSATAELAYSQYAGPLLFRVRTRVYQQTAARFFKDAFYYQTEGEAGEYFTGDRELGKLRHVITGAKMTYIKVNTDGKKLWGVFDQLRFNLKADALFLTELPADDPTANPFGIDGQFLSSDQLLDGVVMQLGLLLAY